MNESFADGPAVDEAKAAFTKWATDSSLFGYIQSSQSIEDQDVLNLFPHENLWTVFFDDDSNWATPGFTSNKAPAGWKTVQGWYVCGKTDKDIQDSNVLVSYEYSCADCDGEGYDADDEECGTCAGRGAAEVAFDEGVRVLNSDLEGASREFRSDVLREASGS